MKSSRNKKDDEQKLELEEEVDEFEKSDSNEMLEVNLELPKDLEINTLKLKKPNEVYIDMYEQTF